MPTPARSLLNQLTDDSSRTTALPSPSRPTSRSRRAGGAGSGEVMRPTLRPPPWKLFQRLGVPGDRLDGRRVPGVLGEVAVEQLVVRSLGGRRDRRVAAG